MPFRFTLQAVLRCRESFEQRERQRLQVITRELVKAEQILEDAQQDRATAIAQLQRKLRESMSTMEMQFELACDRARQRRIAAFRERAEKLQDLRRRQLEMFRKAQQQRKIFDNLRDRQLAAYLRIQARREQQRMDERFLITRAKEHSRE